MIFELFLIGTVWFWLLLAFVAALLFAALSDVTNLHEEDFDSSGPHGGRATFLLIGLFVVLWLFGDFNVIKWGFANFKLMSMIVGGYFLGGFIWVWPKWWLYCRNKYDQLIELKERFLSRKGIKEENLTEQLFHEWTNVRADFCRSIGNINYDAADAHIPQYRNHKSSIMTWMAYWPFSLLATFLNDAVKRAWEAIYNAIGNRLQSISTNMFKDADFKPRKKGAGGGMEA